MEKYIAATGGRERYEAVHTMELKAEVSGELNPNLIVSTMPVRANQTGVLETYSAAPNRHVSITEYAGRRGVDASGCDGQRAWYAVGGLGLRQETKGKLFESMCVPMFDFPLHWRERFKKAEFRGAKRVSGREMLVVRLSYAEDNYVDNYFDAQSYFLLQQVRVHKISGAILRITASYSDFRMVDGGLIFPFHTVQESDQIPARSATPTHRASSNVLSIKLNVPIDPAIFKAPIQH
ncbi:MAG: hypothetical protein LAN64_17060 [Acidobacteriia bacterium]|nr:hypothetical protein [Terriglobia bacterium]